MGIGSNSDVDENNEGECFRRNNFSQKYLFKPLEKSLDNKLEREP